MSKDRSVVYVHLHEPYQGECDWFFGSVSAIYDQLPESVVGVKAKSMWGRFKDGIYRTRKAIIKRGVIHAKITHRGSFRR